MRRSIIVFMLLAAFTTSMVATSCKGQKSGVDQPQQQAPADAPDQNDPGQQNQPEPDPSPEPANPPN